MSLPVTVPFTFGNATTTQSLSSLDTNFTTITNSVNGLTNGASKINVASITATGTANGTTYLRGDGAWATVSGGGGNSSIISNGTSNVSVTSSNGPVSIATNGNNAVYVDTSGNVAIGVSSTTRKLDVYTSASSSSNNTIRVWGYQAAFEVLNQGSTQNWYFGVQDASSNKLYIGRGSNAAQGISPSIAIDTSDNVLVGTTSVINGSNAILQVLNVNGGRPGVNVGNSVGSSATNCVIFTNSNGTVGSIVTSGSATGYNTSSDYRLKENITLMTAGLEKISALKPVIYDWISDKTKGEGFIAHELQEVISHAVTGEKDAVDADGKPIYQGVDYSKIVVHLVAAIQELSAKNDALEARLVALESK